MADLQEEGNTLVDIQRLIICVMVSILVGRRDINNLEGKGSDEHVHKSLGNAFSLTVDENIDVLR